MVMGKVNFQDKFGKFDEHWTPKVIAEMNDYQFKLVKVKGEFVWHNHSDTDEVFIVIEGCLKIEFAVHSFKIHLRPSKCVFGCDLAYFASFEV